tara:strand:+ start:489 stop:734 length:246 start_codon:yes stop_codon:yes gene_type:complete
MQDNLQEAKVRLAQLLVDSCDVSFAQIHDVAQGYKVSTSQLLGEAETSTACTVDYATGRIRCAEEPEETEDSGEAEDTDES